MAENLASPGAPSGEAARAVPGAIPLLPGSSAPPPPHQPSPAQSPPSLAALFRAFVSIGLSSFGGGLTAWVRREIVQRRGWLDDQQFLSGYALSQLVPGATNVNLAVFIGTQLRGVPGAMACFFGLTAPPLLLFLALGAIYFGMRGMPGGVSVSVALSGMGAVAIGLNMGTGIRLARGQIRRVVPALIAATVALSVGVAGFPLLRVLAIMIPVSLAAAWWSSPSRDRTGSQSR